MLRSDRLLAVLPVRGGALPPATSEAVSLSGGAVLMIGEGVLPAARGLRAVSAVRCVEVADFRPAAVAACLVPVLAEVDCAVLPASADGRSLAARLAFLLGRPLWSNLVCADGTAVCLRADGNPGPSVPWDSVRGVVTVRPRAGDRCTVAGPPCAPTSVRLAMPELPDARPLGLVLSGTGPSGT